MMRRPLLILLCLLSVANAFPQTETVVYDGYLGFTSARVIDTVFMYDIVKKSPAGRAGIKNWEILLEIDGIKVSGPDYKDFKHENLLAGMPGDTVSLKIRKYDIDSAVVIDLIQEYNEDRIGSCLYEYLVDSTGEWTIGDILTDSVNRLFSRPLVKKAIIHSVEAGSKAAAAGFRPGDTVVNFYDELSTIWQMLEKDASSMSDDTVAIIHRDTLCVRIPINTEDNPFSGVLSQFGKDLRSNYFWFKIELRGRISEDRPYLLYFQPDDSAIVYEITPQGEYTQTRTGRLIPAREKKLVYKDSNPVLINLKKDDTKTIYVRATKMNRQLETIPVIFYQSYWSVQRWDRLQRLILGVLWGMMLIIALYYLILYTFIRETSYVYYVLFIAGLVLVLFVDSGYSAEFLRQRADSAFQNIYLQMLGIPLSLFLLFGSTYLNLKNHLKTWRKIILGYFGLIWLFYLVVFIISNLASGYSPILSGFVLEDMSVVLLVGATLILVPPAILRVRRGFKPAWFFLAANIILIILVAYSLIFEAFITESFSRKLAYHSDLFAILSDSSVHIASVIQILLFGAGLGMKIRNTERERRIAQEEMIRQLQENEKLKDKVNRELEAKVRERTKEISEQKEEIESQRDLLHEQKQEITDSINYAQRIQLAVLPSEETLREYLPDYFVLFKPRDIVSGDFYWIKQVKNFTLVVAADCTGHGVPGAFMSMLGISFLNELVSRTRLDSAGVILDRLRNKVKTTLKQEGRSEEQKDGMDLSLAILDSESNEIQYAGAFNPLFIVRRKDTKPRNELVSFSLSESETHWLVEIKGDRQPIAIHENETDFQTHRIRLDKGDTLYMFSDGYPDQMGGAGGKKFMVRKFKQLLLSIQGETMPAQKEILDKTLQEWQQNVQQVDDILVFGIRLN